MSDSLQVVDLFSGAGGISFGFHAHPRFRVAGAADAQIGKPSTGEGRLHCNLTYKANMGFEPLEVNLATVEPSDLRSRLEISGQIPVLLSCAPCTGLTRTNPANHIRDDIRNSLVARSALFVEEFAPQVMIMENARELIMGNHDKHLKRLTKALKSLGYKVRADIHFLNEFGLPQKRERALVVAVKDDLPLYGMQDLWRGYRVNPKATHVRRAIWDLPPLGAGERDHSDAMHVSPRMNERTLARLQATPHDGGSWSDLTRTPETMPLLTPAMRLRAEKQDWGSHPDVYGRLWWDRPAATIKRECSHVGNGRYAHPEQDRQCTVRELAILSGFPRSYQFAGGLSNMYRHIGDAVPPLISYQLAALASWILGGARPTREEMVLQDTHLTPDDIEVLAG